MCYSYRVTSIYKFYIIYTQNREFQNLENSYIYYKINISVRLQRFIILYKSKPYIEYKNLLPINYIKIYSIPKKDQYYPTPKGARIYI